VPVTPIAAVLLDIEGTTTPVAFVHEVLFPYARSALPEFLAAHSHVPDVAAALAEVRRLAPGRDTLGTLLHWMDEDAKVTPLKTIQGLIWREGYGRGVLRGRVYDDVAPSLRRWSKAGLRLAVFSSGSSEAQQLLFTHTPDGDLSGLFSGFFDTRVGGKRDADSYARLAIALRLPTAEILFLSDIEAELDAAAVAGMRTCQLVRPQDGTIPSDRHPTAADLPEAERRTNLPSV
jgi:enolase-phosphatase E1